MPMRRTELGAFRTSKLRIAGGSLRKKHNNKDKTLYVALGKTMISALDGRLP